MSKERQLSCLIDHGYNRQKQAGLILWCHGVRCNCCQTFPGLYFCPVAQGVNHYQIFIPTSRKMKNEISKGINQKLHMSLYLHPMSMYLNLPYVVKTGPQRGWELFLDFLATSQAKVDDCVTGKEKKNVSYSYLLYVYVEHPTKNSSPFIFQLLFDKFFFFFWPFTAELWMFRKLINKMRKDPET